MTDNKDRFKFKFFENKTKILHEVHEINLVEKTIFLVGGGARFFKDGTLIQSTGLKDKNGKLIYEGDIVKVSEYSILESKEFDVIRTVQRPDPFYGYDFTYGEHSLKYVEIIGNKFENPELLKK